MVMAKTMLSAAIEECPGLVVTLHHAVAAPADADWVESVELLLTAQQRYGLCRQIVFTDSPRPNAAQRKRASQLVVHGYVGVVVTPNHAIRGVVAALRWLGVPRLSAFAPHQVGKALSVLGHDAAAKVAIATLALRHRSDLGGGPAQALSGIIPLAMAGVGAR